MQQSLIVSEAIFFKFAFFHLSKFFSFFYSNVGGSLKLG